MNIELYTAEAELLEAFDSKDEPIEVVVAHPPRRISSHRFPDDGNDLRVYLGRARDYEANGLHLEWAAPGSVEDPHLSREQLLVERFGGRWQVQVPGIADQKPDAVLQYWGSRREIRVRSGGPGVGIDAGTFAQAVVRTSSRFYWALLTVPAASAEVDRAAQAAQRRADGRRTTVPINKPNRSVVPLKDDWVTAAQIKFRPFLTWPMGWLPIALPPADYPDPSAEFVSKISRPGVRLRVDKDENRKIHAEWVKRRLRELNSDSTKRGYPTPGPNAIDVSLLEFAVETGDLRFGDHALAVLTEAEGGRPGWW